MTAPSQTRIFKQLGNNLRTERLKAGLSQEALAQVAELDRTYVGSVERGERNISLLNIVKLAKVLGIAPAALLKGM